MSVDWEGYEPFDPGVSRPLSEVTKREAREAFRRLMASKGDRIEQLRGLLDRNGVTLSSDDAGLQAVNDWFREEVEGDPGSDGRLRPLWYAVVNDLSLHLGDVIIERSSGLEWVMFDKGRTSVSYQRHVIVGFTGVANPRYNVDIDLLLATYGHRIVAREGVERTLVTWVKAAGDNPEAGSAARRGGRRPRGSSLAESCEPTRRNSDGGRVRRTGGLPGPGRHEDDDGPAVPMGWPRTSSGRRESCPTKVLTHVRSAEECVRHHTTGSAGSRARPHSGETPWRRFLFFVPSRHC